MRGLENRAAMSGNLSVKYLSFLLLLPLSLHAADNLLGNPGFEEEQAGWAILEKEPISSVSPDAAHDGKLGLRITDESKENGANVSSDRFPVTPGQKVSLGFWSRSTTEGIGAVMLVPFSSTGRAILNQNGKPECVVAIKKDKGDWDRHDVEYTVPDGASTLGVSIRTWTGSVGTADLDDFELKIE